MAHETTMHITRGYPGKSVYGALIHSAHCVAVL